MKQDVLLLNGPSSSGKSTLAKELKRQLEEQYGKPYQIVSIDDFLHMEVGETVYEDDVYEISPRLCVKVEETLRKQVGVIIDHVITSERIYQVLADKINQNDFFAIKVTCPLNVLLQREKDRRNRTIGTAASSFEYLYQLKHYDFTVDTSMHSCEECAQMIMQGLRGIDQ